MKMDHEAVYGVESNMFQELAFRDFINDPELVGVAIFPVRATDDKESDARVVQARALAGKLYFVRGAWNEEAINELIEFPNGSHDDQVDTISRGVKMAFFRGGAKKKAKGWQG
jgi:predicted phage terminase large subunit-like protein